MGKHLKQKSASVPKKRYEKQKKKNVAAKPAPPRKTFLDMIAPGVMKFNPDVYVRDNLYCCVWALKEYPAATEDQAILVAFPCVRSKESLDGRPKYSERHAFQYP